MWSFFGELMELQKHFGSGCYCRQSAPLILFTALLFRVENCGTALLLPRDIKSFKKTSVICISLGICAKMTGE